MRCSQFLDLYSDYRDGLITDPCLEGEVRMHLRHCRCCMNYDAAISRGVMALRATNNIQPSHPIHHDSYHSQPASSEAAPELEGVKAAHAGIMAGLMTVAAVAILIWSGPAPEEERSSPPVATASSAPPFMTVAGEVRPVNLTDTSVPAYGRELPSDSIRRVPFDRWISLAH